MAFVELADGGIRMDVPHQKRAKSIRSPIDSVLFKDGTHSTQKWGRYTSTKNLILEKLEPYGLDFDYVWMLHSHGHLIRFLAVIGTLDSPLFIWHRVRYRDNTAKEFVYLGGDEYAPKAVLHMKAETILNLMFPCELRREIWLFEHQKAKEAKDAKEA